MTLEEMKDRKRELGYSLEQLSELSGIPVSTLKKIFSAHTKSPRRDTIEKLTAVLERHFDRRAEESGFVREAGISYGGMALSYNRKQGEYTVDDYLALPDEQRYELIDGALYDMGSPSRDHQMIAGELYFQLQLCARAHQMHCRPYISPLDVQLNQDNKTMVQPDVIVCCDEKQDSGQRIFGAPDFVAEVLSPSTALRDRYLKYKKYKEAGVREYWMIDPARRKVIVCLFQPEDDIDTFTFQDPIPVFISDGMCEISFRELEPQLEAKVKSS